MTCNVSIGNILRNWTKSHTCCYVVLLYVDIVSFPWQRNRLVLLTATCSNNTKGTYCCVSMTSSDNANALKFYVTHTSPVLFLFNVRFIVGPCLICVLFILININVVEDKCDGETGCEVWGFLSGVTEDSHNLGCHAVSIGRQFPNLGRNVVRKVSNCSPPDTSWHPEVWIFVNTWRV